MFKNIAIGTLTIAATAVGIWGYQTSQRAVVLEVLLGEKNKEIGTLELEKSELMANLKATQAELEGYQVAEAALNAAVVSDADLKEFGKPCKEWIARAFGDKSSASYTQRKTAIQDSWIKDSRLVFEISTPSPTGNSQGLYLCVVDKEKGSMFKPSAFETESWRKPR